MKELFKKSFLSFPVPRYTRQRNLRLFDWMNHQAAGKSVLNLGSGAGTFDHYLNDNIHLIRLDSDYSAPRLDILGDAHFLPFKDESIDIIYSIAVLEHVKKPWMVAEEIHRVLCPGGHVVLELPFLNIIHDEDDYFRFTDKGIKSLFEETKFFPVLEQVGSGGGSFLSVFLFRYFRQFVPTKYLKACWDISMSYIFSLCKYLDVPIKNSKDLRLTANSFSYIGRKL